MTDSTPIVRVRKTLHEIRDPIHGFIRVDDDERAVIDSLPVQRLRHVHQLAMTYLVYPGATHRRFEHSLGVMELAGRVYDVLTDPTHLTEELKALLPDVTAEHRRSYWKRVVRMAALCHDLGHLPFSHAAEKELLPDGWNHERLSVEIIRDSSMERIWRSMRPPLDSLDIAKIAVGKKILKDETYSDWEAILSEIIVGDAFGVDRIDYLLRDSLHAGVAYGRFDHPRLIDTLRILRPPSSATDASELTGVGTADEVSIEPQIGVEEGGLHAAEGLGLARYFMFSQVYLHPVRRVYDIHLRDFLIQSLDGAKLSTDVSKHLNTNDIRTTAQIFDAASDPAAKGHEPAQRIVQRDHFKVLWQWNPEDVERNPEAGGVIYAATIARFGADHVRRDRRPPSSAVTDFPVRFPDGRISSSLRASELLARIPPAVTDFVFVSPSIISEAKRWLRDNLEAIITAPIEQGDSHGSQ